MNKLEVTICGCGNGAHACAAMLSRQGHIVNIYSPLSDEIDLFKANYEQNDGLTLNIGLGNIAGLGYGMCGYSEESNIEMETYKGLKINKITDRAEEAIPGASIIIVITPAFAHRDILNNVKIMFQK